MCKQSSDLTTRRFSGTRPTVSCWRSGPGADSGPAAQDAGAREQRAYALSLLLCTTGWLPVVGAAIGLSGCWTPPTARLPADAIPGTIAGPLSVHTVIHAATVESVACDTRTITLRAPDTPHEAFVIGPHVTGWERLRQGDELDVRVKVELTVYIPPAIDGSPESQAKTHPPDARVLIYEPSFRMLTLEYPDGATDTFKVSLGAHVHSLPPGAWVSIRPVEASALHARSSSPKLAGTCASGDVKTATAGVP
jgi:hypothetical protein